MGRVLAMGALAFALLSMGACKKATFCGEYPELCPTNEGGAGGTDAGGSGGGGEAPGGASP